MTTDEYLTEIFRAQLALFRYHVAQHDTEEANDDLGRAERIAGVLALRYPMAHCRAHYQWFLEGVSAI